MNIANNNEKVLNLLSNRSEIKALFKEYLEKSRIRSEQKSETLGIEIKVHASNLSNWMEDNREKSNKALEEIIETSYYEFTSKNALAWSEYLRKEKSSEYRGITQLLSKVDNAKFVENF